MLEDERDDEWLAAAMTAALRERDDVPAWLYECGYAAYTWLTIDAELATVTYDSADAAREPAGSRSEQASLRAMTFSCPLLTIEIELASNSVMGQLIQAGSGQLLAVFADGTQRELPVDDGGCFTIHPTPAVAFRFQFAGADGPVATDWIRL